MAQEKPTKPYLKDLSGKTQFQFEILKKYNKDITYTATKNMVKTLGPVTEETVSDLINQQFVELLKRNEKAVIEVRSVRDYLNSISGDNNNG